ncbi:hypothetical protein [Joostella sp. CR20]|uniref:hypothetical protein n=1 Tax=Joostella sp. CR20 TaxID=2804312 RepID=UPI00313B94AD
MKKLLVVAFIFTSLFINAQDKQDYIDLIKANLNLEIKSFVYDELELSATERETFAPIFDNYLEESGKIVLEKASLFDDYVHNLSALSSEEINDLNKNVIKTDLQKVKTDKKYYSKFVKAIGVEKTTAFFFIKRYLDNTLEGSKLDFLAE